MEIFGVLAGIAISVYIIGALCIWNFIPIIFKYGITIIEYNLGKMIKLDFSNKIGKEYKMENTKIKIISQNEILFIVEPKSLEHRIIPYFINKCIFENDEYKIISKIPLTYLIFPLVTMVLYILERNTEYFTILLLTFSVFVIIHIFYNNWKMKFMIDDIKKFLNGNLL